jgi:cytochrome c oxidase subunit 2
MRRGSALQLVLIGVVAGGAATAVALFLPWLPRPASVEAHRIDDVFWFVIGICIAIFAVVVAMIVYSMIHFRARPDDDTDGPPIHGHTGLEIAWTLVPTLLVTAIGILSAIVLARDDHAGKHPLRIHVIAQQFEWSFVYPQAPTTQQLVLRLPVHRSILLDFTSKDVIHSFWVPEFGQKQDTVPGLHPTLHITPDRIGTYTIVCTELCGLGHALMRSTAIVMSQAAYDKWAASLKGGGPSASSTTPSTTTSPAAALALFTGNGCSSCHTLAAAKAVGKVGPDLDKLPAEAARAKVPLASFIRTSIVDPNAYVEPGFPKGVMPQTFGKTLSKQQLDALVQYLISSSKGG